MTDRSTEWQEIATIYGEAIERVRELHKPFQNFCTECSRGQKLNDTDDYFVAVPYPCPTIKALDGEQ